jgi:hypothetical protein
MCIFTGNVEEVGSTKIFVSDLGEQHCTAYEMKLNKHHKNVAMVLPVPSNDIEFFEFVSLKECPNFFKELDKCFPERKLRSASVASRMLSLPVFEVGDFIASIVPNRSAFLKLDEQFRLSMDVWKALPKYSDWMYAVFQLKKGLTNIEHPIAYKYKPLNSEQLFFPTIHVHEGHPEDKSYYDHTLYYQSLGKFTGDAPEKWETSRSPKQYTSDEFKKSQEFVNDDKAIVCRRIDGYQNNTDLFLQSGSKITELLVK